MCICTHTETCLHFVKLCVYVYMYIDIFLHNKWSCSFSVKRGSFSAENLDKTETLLSDHHFPQDACWFLFSVAVFNQTVMPGRAVAHTALPFPPLWRLPEPRGTPALHNPPRRKNLVCRCMSAGLAGASNLEQLDWEGPSGWVKPAVGSEALRLCPWLAEGQQLCPSVVARGCFIPVLGLT